MHSQTSHEQKGPGDPLQSVPRRGYTSRDQHTPFGPADSTLGGRPQRVQGWERPAIPALLGGQAMDTEMTSQNEPVNSEVDSAILSSRAFYQHDPLLVLLKDKLHLGTLWIVVGGSVLPGLFFSIFPPIYQSGF